MIKKLVTALIVCVTTGIAVAQESSALINKALDEQVKLTLDTTLPQAMSRISDKTGVRIKDDPIIWDLLPWGRDTAVKATFENVTLREALEVITRKLGLTMTLREQAVEIGPMPALKRSGTPARLRGLPSGSNSVGRVSASQAECRGFEPRLPLHSPLVSVNTPTT